MAAEKLLTYYPSKEQWADALARVQSRKTFAARFGLDILRLRLVSDGFQLPTVEVDSVAVRK